ncbi:MAG: formate dehydrogenase [Chloroflexi bacterium]|nr:formate dehydrogenase [Chloroflexota bacterium]
MNTTLPVEKQDLLATLRGFLKQLMQAGVLEALLVPLEYGGSVVPALVTDSAMLEKANPLLPVMTINSARAVSALTGKQVPAKLGVVLRSCELRALVELAKLQQASLEGLTLIGLDCPGTCELDDFLTSDVWKEENRSKSLEEYLSAAHSGSEPQMTPPLRSACRMCIRPVPENVDIHIRLFGADTTVVLPVTIKDEIAAKLQWIEAAQGEAWSSESSRKAVADITTGRREVRDRELADTRAKIDANGGIAGMFTNCIRCHNCSTACPICYCKTCLFKTAAFDHAPDYYFNAARRKGAARMLGDTLLFHLTRLNHMSASCVSCGMCTSACPANIPVGSIFSAVGEQVQAAFEYVPGREVTESLPLITFQQNEWTEVGEEK